MAPCDGRGRFDEAPKSGKVYVLVADKALQRIKAELKALTPRNWGRSLDDCIRGVNVLLRGWLGYVAICDEKQVRPRRAPVASPA